MDPNKLCMGCMREKPESEGSCPYCGFDAEVYERKRTGTSLPLFTILQGKYLVGKVIGEGGFGITYLGWHLGLEIKVAIKEYFPLGLTTRDTTYQTDNSSLNVRIIQGNSKEIYYSGLENIEKEAKTLARFAMPGVVRIYDTFRENNTAYMVMDYVDGINLKQWMRQKNSVFAEEEALRILTPVMDAMDELHEQNLVHRDISPDNIMIDKKGRATLIDFGAARNVFANQTKSLSVILKHGYAPPEQYSSRGQQGPWTDVYAMCATIMYMITGMIPDEAFERAVVSPEEDREKLQMILQQNRISENVKRAILHGLEVKTEKRIRSMGQLKRELFDAADFYSPKKEAEKITLVKQGIPAKSEKPQIRVGDIIGFGTYRQSLNNDRSETIEWEVMEINGNSALVWSRYPLDCRRYNEDYKAVAWETCTLREWLNDEFFHRAFSMREKEAVIETIIETPENPQVGTEGGNATKDRVFLLSLQEIFRFYDIRPYEGCDKLQKKPTKYAIEKGVLTANAGEYAGECWYWLRSSGLSASDAAIIRINGAVNMYGGSVNLDGGGVRPALYLDISKLTE